MHREKFLKGAGEKGIIPSVAEQIFEQAAKFAGYGFNKGHAAAYAQVAYQTAYLKANYPVEFLAASMTLDIGNTDRLNIFRQEAQRLGVKIVPPDINRSEAVFACDARAGCRCSTRWPRSRAWAARRWIMWWTIRGGGRALQIHFRFRPPGGSQAGQQAGLRKSRPGRAPSTA